MHTENQIVIHAPPARVFELAAQIERWPEVLRHYRYVRVTDRAVGGDRCSRLVAMGAARSGIPVRWTSLQHLDPRKGQIRYRHVGGVTRGMDVVWLIQGHDGSTHVTIVHDLLSPRSWLRIPLVSFIIGSWFVQSIADATLAGVKAAAERVS